MRKSIKAIALAVVLAAMPVAAFAAGSTDTNNTDYSSDSSDGSGSGGSSTSGVSNAGTTPGSITPEATTTTVTTATGVKVTVEGSTTNSNGVTSGLVDNGSGATVATGNAATAGLDPEVVETINAVNNGDISNIPGIDTTGMSAYGSTVAVRAEAGNQAVSIYVSELPASGVVKIAFYNNYTGTWSLIDATVDPETNTVTFTAPISGTAVVVG
jgi:serine/threonine-protein kinase